MHPMLADRGCKSQLGCQSVFFHVPTRRCGVERRGGRDVGWESGREQVSQGGGWRGRKRMQDKNERLNKTRQHIRSALPSTDSLPDSLS